MMCPTRTAVWKRLWLTCVAVLWLGVLVFGLVACKDPQTQAPFAKVLWAPASAKATRATTAKAAATPIEKYRLYEFALINSGKSLDWVYQGYGWGKTIRKWYPTLEGGELIRIRVLAELGASRAAIGWGRVALPKAPELDAAAQRFATAFATLDELLAKARPYYEQKRYKEDEGRYGRVLNRSFRKAFPAAFAARKQFTRLLAPKLDGAELAELERLALDPKQELLLAWRKTYRHVKLLRRYVDGDQSEATREEARRLAANARDSYNLLHRIDRNEQLIDEVHSCIVRAEKLAEDVPIKSVWYQTGAQKWVTRNCDAMREFNRGLEL